MLILFIDKSQFFLFFWNNLPRLFNTNRLKEFEVTEEKYCGLIFSGRSLFTCQEKSIQVQVFIPI